MEPLWFQNSNHETSFGWQGKHKTWTNILEDIHSNQTLERSDIPKPRTLTTQKRI